MHSSDPDFDIMFMNRYQTREEVIRLRKENRALREALAAITETLEKRVKEHEANEGRSSE